jgi:2-polyprenyl-3-methyl-5-hydroxy-6-metoxy-1,4-benzoquinol methylase
VTGTVFVVDGFGPTVMLECAICNSQAKHSFSTDSTSYYQCQSCGLVFTDQVPQQDYAQWSKSPNYRNWEEYLTNVFVRIAHDIEKYKQRGKVLEIGSSLGYLLTVLRSAGFDVEGIEPSNFAVNYSRQRGLKVEEGYFQAASYPKESFDIVIANHVLEHVPGPAKLLTQVNEVLKAEGIIFVSLPNFGSIEAQLFRQHWRFLMADQHYFQFNPKTLTQILSQNGFDVLDVKTTVTFTELASPWREIRRACLKDRKQLLYYVVEFLPATLQVMLGRGTGLQVIAAKK